MPKRSLPLPTLDEATKEVGDLWASYRAARDAERPPSDFEALQARVRTARAQAKKRAAEPGFSALAQQLADLGEYIKRFKPRATVTIADPRDLAAEVAEIRANLPKLGAAALRAKAARVQARIEEARAQSPEGDPDHDAYVGIEEELWDLGFSMRDEEG